MSEEYTPHRFNREVAAVYGINAALVYQYVSFRSCEQRCNEKSKWVDFTIDELCLQYPYLGRWQVWTALQKLIHPGKKTPPLILRKNVGNIYLYAPVASDFGDALHIFDVNVAVKLGVVPAIIFHNVGFWIKKNWKEKAELLYGMLDPEDFNSNDRTMNEFAYHHTRLAAGHFETIKEWVTKHHPYLTERTARRGFSCLQKAGWFRFRRIKRGKPMWFFTKKLMNEFCEKMLSKSDLENVAAKTKQVEAKTKYVEAKTKQVEAKTKQKPGLSNSPAATSDAFDEAVIDEAVSDCRNEVPPPFDHSAARSFADAHDGLQSAASIEHFVSRKELSQLRKLTQPNFPSVKAKIKKDAFGRPVKRKYTRALQIDDPDFLERMEDMTEDERQRFLSKR